MSTNRIAVLTADLFEDVELWYPYYRLLEAGYEVELVGKEEGAEYTGKRGTSVTATMPADDVTPDDFDAVIIPGGYSPDHMRRVDAMVRFVRDMADSDKLVAAICHGPWMLASAGVIDGRDVTAFHSIKDDLVNAGGNWVDQEAVRDGNLVTSRKPDDLPAFMRTVIEALAE